MVRNTNGHYYIEGFLSFHRGCQDFTYRTDGSKSEFSSYSESPLAFTKLSCYLPWVAEQFGLSYEDHTVEDEACVRGTGQRPPYDTVCRANPPLAPGAIFNRESPCIFPFYYKGKGPFNNCTLFDQQYFDVPVWRCPTRNITVKFPGTDINHFEEDEKALSIGYCYDLNLAFATCNPDLEDGGPDCQRVLDPDNDNCFSFLRLPPFSTCKSDCPAVRSFGVIGGGAVLFTASALAGQTILPMLGAATFGATAALVGGGTVISSALCIAPFCRASSGQCCLLTATQRGPRCPSSY